MAKINPLGVKIGDIVLLDFNDQPGMKDRGSFEARVLETKVNDTGSLIIRYERLDGVQEYEDGFSLANVSWVKKVIEPAPYVVKPRVRVNIFSPKEEFSCVEKNGGLRVGHFTPLVLEALSTVRHVDLAYFLHEERARQMYDRACRPGQVAHKDSWMSRIGMVTITVRWKTFRRWVHRNAFRLVATKTEYLASRRELNRQMDDEMWDTLGNDMDRMAEEEFSEESFEPMSDPAW